MTASPHLVPARELDMPSNEQLHRLRAALLGRDTSAAAVQPIEMLRRLVENVDNETVIHLLIGDGFECPDDWQTAIDAVRGMLGELVGALRGTPLPPGREDFADPWATLRMAGFGKRETP